MLFFSTDLLLKETMWISVLVDGDRRPETKEQIYDHVLAFYADLFSKENINRPSSR